FANLQAQPTPEPLIVHEWGTFTSLQNEASQAIGGINTDDEPVPRFVHRLTDWLLLSPTEVPASFFQGAPSCHPDVTLRLETPVLYFHLPGAWTRIPEVSVTARFRGGWLTEFYPNALADAPGVSKDPGGFGPLRSDTVSTLAWNNLDVGGDENGPPSNEHVWAGPRGVREASVRTPGGEAERFLFYRGVGHIDAPIAVARNAVTAELVLRSHLPHELAGRESLEVKSAWLVDVDAYGAVAFRVLPALRLGGTGTDNVLLRQGSSGRQSLEEYGISVPRSYQLYLALGRFRNALLLDEVARRPTPTLEAFIYAHGLQGYRPAETSVTARRPSLFDPATSTP